MKYTAELERYCNGFNLTLNEVEQALLKITNENHPYFKTKNNKGQFLEMIYFTALSMAHPEFDDILEMGTGKAENIQIISKMWPKAKIITCDLSKDDHEYQKLGIRRNDMDKFNERLSSSANVEFFPRNSFFLPEFANKKFDFIWVDGGHSYPAVAWDIMFAYNNCKPGGYIYFDDYGPEGDVKHAIENIKQIIDEEIHTLPWSGYRDYSQWKVCWMRKK